MRKRIGFFKIRIRFKEHLSSLFLTFCPFVGRFEKQISAASQQLLVGVTVCKHNWNVCFTQTFGLFPGIRVCLNGIPSMRDAHLLQGITCKFLYMKAVYGTHCIRETASGYKSHGIRHVHCYLLNHQSLVLVNAHKCFCDNICRHTFYNSNDGTFTSM